MSDMFHFEQGRSYAWHVLIFLAVFIGGNTLSAFLGAGMWGVLVLPVGMLYVLICELRSAVALDSQLRASYAKGTWQYSAKIAWHTTGLIALVGLSYWFIVHSPPG